MYKKRITLAQIKQEAQDLKQLNPNLKHTQALNKIAQKYGYEKFEILKATLANLGTKITLKATPLKNYTKENQQIAIIGGSGSGKTTLLFREHEYLDRKTTLFITPSNKNSLNGYPYCLEKEGYEKHYKKTLPVFKKAIFKTFNDKDIDFSKFETIIVEEALMLKINSNMQADLKKIIAEKSKAVVLTFQEKEAAKELGLGLNHKEDLRDYENHRPIPLDLLSLYVGNAGMSYFGKIDF